MFKKPVKKSALIIVDPKSILIKQDLQIAMLFPGLIRKLITKNRKYNMSYIDQQLNLKKQK